MIIVDAHTHMHGNRFTSAGMDRLAPNDFVDVLDSNGVDVAWVFTLDGLYGEPREHNDRLSEFCSVAPDRLIPFCTVQPRDPDAISELNRCVLLLGMRGVKLHPWAQSFSPLESFMGRLGEELERLDVPVEFHDGTPPYSSPLQISSFAERHPQVTVILGHGGLHDLWKEAVLAAERTPNVYLVPSGMPPYGLRHALSRLPAQRFLFGSDAGFSGPHVQAYQKQKIRSLRLSIEEEELIFGGNAKRILRGRVGHVERASGGLAKEN